MTFIEAIPITKDIVLIVASIITSLSAMVGVFSWKRKLRVELFFDESVALIIAAYKVRRCFNKFIADAKNLTVAPGLAFEPYNAELISIVMEKKAPLDLAVEEFKVVEDRLEPFTNKRLKAKVEELHSCIFSAAVIADNVMNHGALSDKNIANGVIDGINERFERAVSDLRSYISPNMYM